MNNQTDKAIIHRMLLDNKEGIIQKYNEGMKVWCIAEVYNVAESTIYIKLKQWKVRKVRSRDAYHRKKPKAKYRRKFSPELLAKMKENTRINNKHIKHIKFKHTTEDQKLIANILLRL